MKKVLLIKQITLISSSLIVLGTPLLSSCDDKLEQTDSKVMIASIGLSSSYSARKHRKDRGVISRALVLTKNVKRSNPKKVQSNTLGFSENLVIEGSSRKKDAALDLSLNLDLKGYSYYQEYDKQSLLQRVFESEGGDLNIEMETHFEGPHNENKEMDMTPDGIGVSIKFGI